MNRRILASAMLVAVALVGSQNLYASTVHVNTPVLAFVGGKVKMVKFNVRNDNSTPITLKAGDNEMTVEPGKTAEVKLPEGTQLIAVNVANHDAGSVLATASSELSGNTVVLH